MYIPASLQAAEIQDRLSKIGLQESKYEYTGNDVTRNADRSAPHWILRARWTNLGTSRADYLCRCSSYPVQDSETSVTCSWSYGTVGVNHLLDLRASSIFDVHQFRIRIRLAVVTDEFSASHNLPCSRTEYRRD
jgi:hypothetical protein